MKYQGFCGKYGEANIGATAVAFSGVVNPIITKSLAADFLIASNGVVQNMFDLGESLAVGGIAGFMGFALGTAFHDYISKNVNLKPSTGSKIVRAAQIFAYAVPVSLAVAYNFEVQTNPPQKLTIQRPQGSPSVHLSQQKQAVIRHAQP